MTDTRRFISLPSCFTTVILFWVSVPVLSEQITCAQPSVSTAVSFRITAFRFDILVTPMESTIVTTAASPSGIAATARLTATIKVFKMFCGVTPSFKMPTTKITAQMASTITLKILLSWFSRFCSGVLSSADCVRTWAIFPISVFYGRGRGHRQRCFPYRPCFSGPRAEPRWLRRRSEHPLFY